MTGRPGRRRTRPSRRGRTALTATLTAVVLLLVATLAGCRVEPDDPPPAPRSCHLAAHAVPTCGVLWGISTQPRWLYRLQSLEGRLGRPFDLVYHYHDIDGRFPDRLERREVAGGRLLHVAIAARDFHRRDGRVSWASVAGGRYDASLRRQARGIASLHVPVFVTFAQEANARKKLGVDGTPADFIAAWRHLHQLYERAGARNAVWTWVMTGSPDNLDSAAALWPGNDVVDWISWNVYNGSGCAQSVLDPEQMETFGSRMRIFYDFVHERGPQIGMDPHKPMMISEAGSVDYPGDPRLGADWYAGIPAVLRAYPQIKAVTLWDSTTATCDFRFDRSAAMTAAVRNAGLDPAVDTRPARSRPSR